MTQAREDREQAVEQLRELIRLLAARSKPGKTAFSPVGVVDDTIETRA